MSLDALRESLPDYARDLSLNLSSLAGETVLNDQQKWGAFLASAHAVGVTPVIAAKVLKLFAQRGSNSKAIDFQLSERELEILKLLAEGYSYKIIAARCNISYATVNTHVSHIYEKLQVKGVASAVNLAVREGLI